MVISAADLMLWLGLTFLFSGGGAYFGAYLKKKGENYATKEDINGVVEQVKVVTTATEEIKAKISNEVWNRQRQWKMKKDALFEAVRELGKLDDALISLNTAYTAAKLAGNVNPEMWLDRKNEALAVWTPASASFDIAKMLACLVCGKEVKDAFAETSLLIRKIARRIFKDDIQNYLQSAPELIEKMIKLEAAIRKELGIDESA